MWLVKAIHRVNSVVNPVSRWVHRAGEGTLALMMLLTATDVILRTTVNRPIMGSFEVTELLLTLVIAFTIAYCAVEKGHVIVELVLYRLPQRAQAIINSVTSLFGLGLFILITRYSFIQAGVLRDADATSGALHIPEFPFLIVTSFGFGLLSLVVLMQFLEYISQAAGKWNQSQ